MARVKRASVKSVAPKKKKPSQNSTEAPNRVSRKSVKDAQVKKKEGGGSGRCAEPHAPGEGMSQACSRSLLGCHLQTVQTWHKGTDGNS